MTAKEGTALHTAVIFTYQAEYSRPAFWLKMVVGLGGLSERSFKTVNGLEQLAS